MTGPRQKMRIIRYHRRLPYGYRRTYDYTRPQPANGTCIADWPALDAYHTLGSE